jgi:transposase-like protein
MPELESGDAVAQIAREYGVHLSLLTRWRDELAENPEKAFNGNGNKYMDKARIAELERLLGVEHVAMFRKVVRDKNCRKRMTNCTGRRKIWG